MGLSGNGLKYSSTKLILIVGKMVTSKFLLVEKKKKVKFDPCVEEAV